MGSEKVQNYADVIYGWSLTIFIFRRKQSGEGNISSPPIRMTNIITGAILRSIWSQTIPTIHSRICVNHNLGGFQLEFVSVSQVINHMTCYKLSALIG